MSAARPRAAELLADALPQEVAEGAAAAMAELIGRLLGRAQEGERSRPERIMVVSEVRDEPE